MAIVTFDVQLKSQQAITPRVSQLSFERLDGAPIPFTAGQFITLHIEDAGKMHHRSYSVANAPSNDNTRLDIAVAFVEGGLASRTLSQMRISDTLSMSGPYGLFVLKEEPAQRLVLVATGTGVSPYRSMLPELGRRLQESDQKVVLLLGVRQPSDLLYEQDFRAMASRHEHFQFYACYSQDPISTLAKDEYQGRVNACFDELQLKPDEDLVYLCGNPMMIDDAFAYLTELGFDRKRVRREKYAFARPASA